MGHLEIPWLIIQDLSLISKIESFLLILGTINRAWRNILTRITGITNFNNYLLKDQRCGRTVATLLHTSFWCIISINIVTTVTNLVSFCGSQLDLPNDPIAKILIRIVHQKLWCNGVVIVSPQHYATMCHINMWNLNNHFFKHYATMCHNNMWKRRPNLLDPKPSQKNMPNQQLARYAGINDRGYAHTHWNYIVRSFDHCVSVYHRVHRNTSFKPSP